MKKYIKIHKLETICLILIIIFSLLNIYKAPLLKSCYSNYFYKQIIWIIISVILFMFIYKIKFKTIFKYRYIIYIVNILLLIYTLIIPNSINGIKAWAKFGIITIQPSEFIKFSFPLAEIKLIKDKKYFLSFILFVIPSILILIEPDTGNFILLLCIYIYLLTNKNNKKYIFLMLIISTIFIIFSILIFNYYPNIIIKLFDGNLYYRFKRIISFNNNFQISNALIGIGSAKMLPIKLNKLLIYIPEGATDFIFAFHICNYGIILTMFLLILYFTFFSSLYLKYHKRLYYFKKKIIGSFLTIFTIQFLYNVLMNIGILPIMGIPLPFFSYGGSNIISYFILYSLSTKKISSIEDKDNNSYKNNYHKGLVDKKYNHMVE